MGMDCLSKNSYLSLNYFLFLLFALTPQSQLKWGVRIVCDNLKNSSLSLVIAAATTSSLLFHPGPAGGGARGAGPARGAPGGGGELGGGWGI